MAFKVSKVTQFNGRTFPAPADKPIESVVRLVVPHICRPFDLNSAETRRVKVSVARVKWLEKGADND